jgi:clan AA aspartic protease
MTIDGYFNARDEPVIRLEVGSAQIEFLVDTGFNGSLIMPDEMASGLEIKYDRGLEELYSVTGEMFLASGCSMEIGWFGERIRVPVVTSAEVSEAILGGQMLKGCRLIIDYGQHTVTVVRG